MCFEQEVYGFSRA